VLDTMLAAYRRKREHPVAETTTNGDDHDDVDDDGDENDLPSSAVRQLRDEIKTFMLAGHETSAAMMTWTLYELVHHPKLVQRLVDEGHVVWHDNNKDKKKGDEHILAVPTVEELSNLELAECCLMESLRKYSVVPMVARLLTKDVTVSDDDDNDHNNKTYTLPKGSAVMIDIVGVHHDPKLWPRPLTYDPDRFYCQPTPPAPYTFIPFIAGPRNCLGQNLALLESKMVISSLLHQYTFRLPDDQVVADTADWSHNDPRHRFIVPLVPKQEVMLYVEKRRDK
jgi:beta-ring hydroxylase